MEFPKQDEMRCTSAPQGDWQEHKSYCVGRSKVDPILVLDRFCVELTILVVDKSMNLGEFDVEIHR